MDSAGRERGARGSVQGGRQGRRKRERGARSRSKIEGKQGGTEEKRNGGERSATIREERSGNGAERKRSGVEKQIGNGAVRNGAVRTRSGADTERFENGAEARKRQHGATWGNTERWDRERQSTELNDAALGAEVKRSGEETDLACEAPLRDHLSPY